MHNNFLSIGENKIMTEQTKVENRKEDKGGNKQK